MWITDRKKEIVRSDLVFQDDRGSLQKIPFPFLESSPLPSRRCVFWRRVHTPRHGPFWFAITRREGEGTHPPPRTEGRGNYDGQIMTVYTREGWPNSSSMELFNLSFVPLLPLYQCRWSRDWSDEDRSLDSIRKGVCDNLRVLMTDDKENFRWMNMISFSTFLVLVEKERSEENFFTDRAVIDYLSRISRIFFRRPRVYFSCVLLLVYPRHENPS